MVESPNTGNWRIPGPCPTCGSPRLRAVSDSDGTNFICESCGDCWFYSMGWLGHVDSAPRAAMVKQGEGK
jgi:hypothetical protein